MRKRCALDLEALLRRCTDPRRFADEEWLDLAGHLASGCLRCWSLVEKVPAPYIRRSDDPLTEALYHVRSSGSWIPLSSDLLSSVRGSRSHPHGFAFLVLEEALEIAVDGHTIEPLLKARQLVETLRGARRQVRRFRDLTALCYAHLATMYAMLRDPVHSVEAQAMAAGIRQGGTDDRRIAASLLEARATSAWALGKYDSAENTLRTAVRILGDEHAVRRFELWGEVAEIIVDVGELHRLPGALAAAEAALSLLRRSGDPFWRLRAIYKRGRLIERLASRLERTAPEHPLRQTEARSMAEEMSEASVLMVEHADPSTRALWLLCQARLYAVGDPDRAEAAYGAATDALDEAGGGAILAKALAELAAVRSQGGRALPLFVDEPGLLAESAI